MADLLQRQLLGHFRCARGQLQLDRPGLESGADHRVRSVSFKMTELTTEAARRSSDSIAYRIRTPVTKSISSLLDMSSRSCRRQRWIGFHFLPVPPHNGQASGPALLDRRVSNADQTIAEILSE